MLPATLPAARARGSAVATAAAAAAASAAAPLLSGAGCWGASVCACSTPQAHCTCGPCAALYSSVAAARPKAGGSTRRRGSGGSTGAGEASGSAASKSGPPSDEAAAEARVGRMEQRLQRLLSVQSKLSASGAAAGSASLARGRRREWGPLPPDPSQAPVPPWGGRRGPYAGREQGDWGWDAGQRQQRGPALGPVNRNTQVPAQAAQQRQPLQRERAVTDPQWGRSREDDSSGWGEPVGRRRRQRQQQVSSKQQGWGADDWEEPLAQAVAQRWQTHDVQQQQIQDRPQRQQQQQKTKQTEHMDWDEPWTQVDAAEQRQQGRRQKPVRIQQQQKPQEDQEWAWSQQQRPHALQQQQPIQQQQQQQQQMQQWEQQQVSAHLPKQAASSQPPTPANRPAAAAVAPAAAQQAPPAALSEAARAAIEVWRQRQMEGQQGTSEAVGQEKWRRQQKPVHGGAQEGTRAEQEGACPSAARPNTRRAAESQEGTRKAAASPTPTPLQRKEEDAEQQRPQQQRYVRPQLLTSWIAGSSSLPELARFVARAADPRLSQIHACAALKALVRLAPPALRRAAGGGHIPTAAASADTLAAGTNNGGAWVLAPTAATADEEGSGATEINSSSGSGSSSRSSDGNEREGTLAEARGVMGLIAGALMARGLGAWRPWDLSLAAWAAAKVTYTDSEFLQALGAEIAAQAPDLSPLDLFQAASAFAQLGPSHAAPGLPAALLARAGTATCQMSAPQAVQTAWALVALSPAPAWRALPELLAPLHAEPGAVAGLPGSSFRTMLWLLSSHAEHHARRGSGDAAAAESDAAGQTLLPVVLAASAEAARRAETLGGPQMAAALSAVAYVPPVAATAEGAALLEAAAAWAGNKARGGGRLMPKDAARCLRAAERCASDLRAAAAAAPEGSPAARAAAAAAALLVQLGDGGHAAQAAAAAGDV